MSLPGPPVWEGRPLEVWREQCRIPALEAWTRIGSTNDRARELAEAGAAQGTTVVADEQTAGRGQAGRQWSARPGASLLLSVVFRHPDAPDPSTMPLRVGLAVARAIENVSGVRAAIKWPNDLVLPAGKLGGILCEAATSAGGGWLIAGIGLNVHQQPDEFPPELHGRAASLRMAGAGTDRATLLAAILLELYPFRTLPPPLEPDVRRQLEARDVLRGRAVDLDGRPAGTALGIEPDGSLTIMTASGPQRVRSGTVRLGQAGGGLAQSRQPHHRTDAAETRP